MYTFKKKNSGNLESGIEPFYDCASKVRLKLLASVATGSETLGNQCSLAETKTDATVRSGVCRSRLKATGANGCTLL